MEHSWRFVGDRYPLQSPSGNRVKMYVVEVDHPNGPWEAIYCHTKDQAVLTAAAPDLLDALTALTNTAKRIDARHHAGLATDNCDWAELYADCQRSRVAINKAKGKDNTYH